MRWLLTLGIFFSVLENFLIFKVIGLLFLLAFLILHIFLFQSLIQLRYLKYSIFICLPFVGSLVTSVGCISSVYSVILNMSLKVTILLFVFGMVDRRILSQSLTDVVIWHTGIFFIHMLLLLIGLGDIWDKIIFLDTQTSFGEVGFISFRATGLFDEPSLYGMTMLALIFSRFLISGSVSNVIGPLMTFSFPTMLYAVFLKFFSILTKPSATKYFFILGVPFFLLFLAFLGLEREGNVKYSPMMLRLNHYLYFWESPNLFSGSGFCSAYGQFSLELGKDELRGLYLGNFKDAGQFLFMADRIGLIVFIVFIAGLFIFLRLHVFLLLVAYLFLSKVPFFSITGTILFFALASHLSQDKVLNRF